MAVVLETTLGDITIDLLINERPRTCFNFLKLCKMKYYNFNLFHTISHNFIAQTGDPTGSRNGGDSIFGVIDGPLKRYFEAETNPHIKHSTVGLVSFVGQNKMIGSQFFITLGSDLTYLDDQHCVFGEVMEGLDVLQLLNEVICDQNNRPYQDVRITHTVILEDPFPDPENLRVPSMSPLPSAERMQGGRIGPDEDVNETEGKTTEEVDEMIAEKEAKARATILEMVGDIPDADMTPPENVLFVCKLNPITTDDDLEIIFSRFGKIKSCEVIRDKKTNDSLQYAFVEFEDRKACEDAYFKMDNVLIDDRRIHVDFSQSVAKVKWHGKGRGVSTYDSNGRRNEDTTNEIGNGKYRRTNVDVKHERKHKDLIEQNASQRKSRYDKERSSRYRSTSRKKEHSDKRRRSRSRSNKREKYRDSEDKGRRDYYREKLRKSGSDKKYKNRDDKTRHRNLEKSEKQKSMESNRWQENDKSISRHKNKKK